MRLNCIFCFYNFNKWQHVRLYCLSVGKGVMKLPVVLTHVAGLFLFGRLSYETQQFLHFGNFVLRTLGFLLKHNDTRQNCSLESQLRPSSCSHWLPFKPLQVSKLSPSQTHPIICILDYHERHYMSTTRTFQSVSE